MLTLTDEAKWKKPNVIKSTTEEGKKHLKESLLQELPVIVRIPEPEMKKIFFAVSKRAISVVYAEDQHKKSTVGKEFVVVEQRAHNEFDCIENVFVTYTCQKKQKESKVASKESEEESKGPTEQINTENFKNEGEEDYEINKVTLHYFEKFFDSNNCLKRATYNVFDLTEDFIYMLRQCGLVIPSVKT